MWETVIEFRIRTSLHIVPRVTSCLNTFIFFFSFFVVIVLRSANWTGNNGNARQTGNGRLRNEMTDWDETTRQSLFQQRRTTTRKNYGNDCSEEIIWLVLTRFKHQTEMQKLKIIVWFKIIYKKNLTFK